MVNSVSRFVVESSRGSKCLSGVVIDVDVGFQRELVVNQSVMVAMIPAYCKITSKQTIQGNQTMKNPFG